MSERDEEVVRMESAMFALVCEMHALVAYMESMKAENAQAIIDGRDLLHQGSGFGGVSDEFDKLAKRFRTEI